MRIFKLTSRGKSQVRVASSARDELLDYLYEQPGKKATKEGLTAVLGNALSENLRRDIKLGYIQEEGNDGYA